MKTAKHPVQSVPMTDFKARCTEYLRAIENGQPPIQVTRHGKAIVEIKRPESTDKPRKTLADSMGALRGTAVFSPDYDPHAPAFADDEWEIND